MDGIAVNEPNIRKDGLKPCKCLKKKISQIGKMGYRSFFASDICYTTKPLKIRVVVCSIP